MARLAVVSHSRDGHSFNCKCSIRVITRYLIVYELLVFLVVLVVIKVPASNASGYIRIGRRTESTLNEF
jgi:hypothetical protein